MDQSERKLTEYDQINRSELKWTEWTIVDQIDQSELEWTEENQNEPN